MGDFAVFDCEDAAKWAGSEKFYIESYGQDRRWDFFKCYNSEFPTLEAARKYKVIFVSGSHYSVYEDLHWIEELCEWIRAFMHSDAVGKLVGICFGNQVLGKAMGGSVRPNPSGRFVLTVETLQLSNALQAKGYFKRAAACADVNERTTSIRLLESHGDQVIQLPEGAELLASSSTARHEIWGMQDRLLAVQGHPEFSCFDALEKIHPYVTRNGRLSEQESAASKDALLSIVPDNNLVNALIHEFIAHAPLSSTAAGVEGPPSAAVKASPEASAATSQRSQAPSSSAPAAPHQSDATLRQQLQELQLGQSAELPVSTGPSAGQGGYRSDADDGLSTATSDIAALTPSTLGESAFLDSSSRASAARSLHAQRLHQQMRDLSDSLASMVHAQMGQQAGQWQLLEDVNSVACNKYSQMAARLQEWMPLLEEAMRKHKDLAPLWQNVEIMSEQMDEIERAIAELSKASSKLAKQLGV